ncbi:MAG: metal-dependent transcriptional regulator [Bacteroidota bacterium]|nr:metal-dependent transcriptional regulator [Bacteroidota bacterium]MDP3147373.1 metal-dependent transcriptional regulator [Bacteroidota bacterium]
MNSFTEENYLKAIFKLLEKGEKAVSTTALSARMTTKAATVTDMIKRLAEKKLINYEKYQGVTLTEKGKAIAISIIRKHRLWEVFLVEKLHFKWDEVHEMAEQLEHVKSEELVNRIDAFLNFPKFDPHGDPIPDAKGVFNRKKSVLLAEINTGQNCIMTGVVDHSVNFLQYLDKVGLSIGKEIKLIEVVGFDKSIQVQLNGKEKVFLSHEVAKNLLVNKQ